MNWLTDGRAVGLVTMVALLFLFGRGVPWRRWVPIIAVTLGIVVLIVWAEQSGVWPAGWRLGR